MFENITRFFCIFTVLLVSFSLSGEASVLAMLGLPTTLAAAAISALVFTVPIFRLNLWTVGVVCLLLMIANAGLPAVGILPPPELCLMLAVTLACLPTLRNLLDR